MSDEAAEQLKADGWTIAETTGFLTLVGPLWQRMVNGQSEHALIAEDKHHNRRGMVQGGLLMTFADRACGMVGPYRLGPADHGDRAARRAFRRRRQDRRGADGKAAGDPGHPQPGLRDRRGDGERAYTASPPMACSRY